MKKVTDVVIQSNERRRTQLISTTLLSRESKSPPEASPVRTRTNDWGSIARSEECGSPSERLEPENVVPALIKAPSLTQALAASNLESGALLKDEEPPILKFPMDYLMTCLHGQHRIQAAREVLKAGDQWWTLDLYVDGSPLFEPLSNCLLTGKNFPFK